FNIMKMAREGLLAELRAAIDRARKSGARERREGLHVRSNGKNRLVNLEVIPFTTASREHFQLVLFEEVPEERAKGAKKRPAKEGAPDSRGTKRMERELAATREYLQSIIEEQETMNAELRSAN